MTAPTLATARLTLRMWRADDFDAYADMILHPAVSGPLKLAPMTRTDAWRHLAAVVGHWHLRGFGLWAVDETATGRLVGRVGCIQPDGWPDFEVGWTLAPHAWGRGFATEAAAAALDWAFDVLNRPHVISVIAPDNDRSRRVAERLGETPAGTATLLGHDVVLYRVTRDEWAARRTAGRSLPAAS